MRKLIMILLFLALVVIVAAPVLADGDDIGRVIWARKCPAEMSVLVTELPDGTNIVECFLYYEQTETEKHP